MKKAASLTTDQLVAQSQRRLESEQAALRLKEQNENPKPRKSVYQQSEDDRIKAKEEIAELAAKYKGINTLSKVEMRKGRGPVNMRAGQAYIVTRITSSTTARLNRLAHKTDISVSAIASLTSPRNGAKHQFHWGFAKKCSK